MRSLYEGSKRSKGTLRIMLREAQKGLLRMHVKIMEQRKITALLVVNQQGELIGAINMHDLLIAKVV